MKMAAQINTKLYLKRFVLFMCQLVFTLGHTQTTPITSSITSCESSSPDNNNIFASGFYCNASLINQCQTFAILRANSHFSSLSNLSLYLGLSRLAVAEANAFSAETDFLPIDQPFLIPIHCQCDASSRLFRSQLAKITVKGESFWGISESLEGLTTCKAIKDKNPNVSPWINNRLVIPLQCACPSSKVALFLTYPVTQGDTISGLANKFNTTQEAIISANNGSLKAVSPNESLKPFTSIFIPANTKPVFGSLVKPHQPNLHGIPVISPRKKKSKMRRLGLYIALSGVLVGVCIAVAAAFVLIQMKKKQNMCKGSHGHGHGQDLELQQLSLSVRTTSDKKVSFDGSNQDTLDGSVITTVATPRNKAALESYTAEELSKATEDFSSSNHIEGSVFHGRLNGKNLAIKRVKQDIVSKLDLGLFSNAIHRHPNIIRMVGTCLDTEENGSNDHSFLVFEYAKNGSLKDWLHGGLAIKNQFIASCYCFLTWSQRLRICLDIAMALQYMHHIMDPCYVHRNIKSRNIFLDEEFIAKVGNFGMEKCVEDSTNSDSPNSSTNPSSWSLGYLAPEYLKSGIISPSIDIFAYGVVLLEVLSGQTPISRPNEKGGSGIRLVERVRQVLESENAEEMRDWIDSGLGESYSFDGAVTLANLARACTEEDPALRPAAEEVVEKLARLVQDSPPRVGECSLVSESSSKPLVKSVANNNGVM